MTLYKKNFVFKKPGVDKKISQKIIDYFQDKEHVSSTIFFNEVNKKISGWQQFYVGLFETSLFNREINIFLFTVILNILFLTIRHYLFIIVEILLIINIVPTLYDIFQAIKLKYLHILLVLLFTYLLVYIFMWFGFFFYQDFFVYDDILESSSGMTITESYCYSSVPCLLLYISLGTRSMGGIGENIDKTSYQRDPKLFLGRFFHDILYFLLIVLILGYVFLAIIIDTFSELRDSQMENENDMNNICFICQLSSDDCLTKNIDFDKHVNTVHNIWNYVYFLAYLNLNNPNNFNRVENSVWEKLQVQDYSWVPIDTSSDD
jgi:inositol 1,4,5-triphosphate receptor type 1/inositol 1,4,5-triphosphate receptor type 3